LPGLAPRQRIAAGANFGSTGIDAIHMLVWSAVLNGIVALPIMAMTMVIRANSKPESWPI
jgi:hypothetical protein